MKSKSTFIKFLILVFFIAFILTSYFIIKDYISYKENEKSNNKLFEDVFKVNLETQDFSIDWNNLKSINTDIIGWIEIEGTKINYPILKDSNLFYLDHSYDKKYNSNGSIFTTTTNFFADEETIIYGHNMKNGSMFSNLGKYLKRDFFYSHLNLKIYTPTGNYQGTIFSAYSVGIEDEINNIKQLNFIERIEYYRKSSQYQIDSTNTISKIVKLSTCSYTNTNTTPTDQRYYIVASIIPMEL